MDSDPQCGLATDPAPDAGVRVEIVRRDRRWPGDAASRAWLRRAAATAARQAAPSVRGEIGLRLSDDAEIRRLNRDWRGRDQATNVLSFSLQPAPAAGGPARPLGDIVLAYETVAREAAERRLSLLHHAAHLTVHGVLHLLGHDHAGEEEAARMEALETAVLATMGVADPYAGDGAEGAP